MKELGTKTLETNRLILRKFTITDAEEMYNNVGKDLNVANYVSFSPHKSVEETKKIISMWIAEYENNSYHWVVELKENHQIIGNISVNEQSKKHNNCEIGYVYGSKFWGNGYATEALQKVLNYLLLECDFHLVEARHYESNPASGKVMQKAGMINDGILRERRLKKNSEEYDNLVIYSITKNDLMKEK